MPVDGENFTFTCSSGSNINQRPPPKNHSYLTGAAHQPAPRQEHGNSFHLSQRWSIFTGGSPRRTAPASYARPSAGERLKIQTGGRQKERGRGPGLHNSEQMEQKVFSFILYYESAAGCLTAFWSATRCQGSIYEAVPLWPPSYLRSIFPLQSAKKPDLGACGESGARAMTGANAATPMTHLPELGPGFLLLHSAVSHQIIKYFSWRGEVCHYYQDITVIKMHLWGITEASRLCFDALTHKETNVETIHQMPAI